jgi:hypothetical protein
MPIGIPIPMIVHTGPSITPPGRRDAAERNQGVGPSRVLKPVGEDGAAAVGARVRTRDGEGYAATGEHDVAFGAGDDPAAEFCSGGEGTVEACEMAGTASVERATSPPGV